MQHPDPGRTGARGSSDAGKSFGYDASVSNKSRAPVQAIPLGPRPCRQRRRARFARSMVFEAFRYKHARAIDYGDFVDRRPDQVPKSWGAST